ncbi:ADP/ATP-dependent (S)-NAD(P)H-hydrate dehydratase [Arachnia propionica]|uniref:ADP-dependent NAD(P)H-hydrate dehydratase n=1 Tax=Arachnia propionica TaxID=1750 RepID=UPI0021AB1E80|nr:ADP/ATP-dependent (S)-NAD(P)H-hydrate dehydratase [Arachnia propionica]
MIDTFTVADLAACWPVPGPRDHKYTRGVVGIDAGSTRYPGAALLAVAGALGTGPGMVRYLGSAPGELVISRHPSVVLADGQVQALVLGPGWGPRADAGQRLEEACSRRVPMVIDADALRHLPNPVPEGCLITPHAGELAMLLGVPRRDVEAEPVAAAQEAADMFRVTVLLKGAVQPVAAPGGQVRLALPGPAWSAQAGSGDVLAGACGTLLAAGLPVAVAALAAASLQALVATRFPGPWPPHVQAARFPGVVADLVSGSAGSGTSA